MVKSRGLRARLPIETLTAYTATAACFDELDTSVQLTRALVRPTRRTSATWCHRQLDPDSVWVTRDGNVLLMALHSGTFQPPGQLTQGPTPWSIYSRLPPEGEASGPPADVFGLAMLLIELLRGAPLAGHSLTREAHHQRLARARASVGPQLGPLAWAAVESMMAADPRQRTDLESVRAGLALLAQRAPGRRLREIARTADLDHGRPPDDAWVGQTIQEAAPTPAPTRWPAWWWGLMALPAVLAAALVAASAGSTLLLWALWSLLAR